MPESPVNHPIERPNEENEGGQSDHSHLETIETIEAVILALVAVAKHGVVIRLLRWDGRRAELYSEANGVRVDAELLATLAGQERIYDNETFDAWLRATFDGKKKLSQFYERRFRPEYRPAFSAWLDTEPFKNQQALPGPMFMPQYHSAEQERSAALGQQAMTLFKRGTDSGDTGDQHVRITVILATVLLITAIGQRFRVKVVRTVFMVVACLLLSVPFTTSLRLPRI
jgi:hypothetical protein